LKNENIKNYEGVSLMVQNVVVNYWAVLLAAIVSMVIGFLWYSPWLFGKTWMKLSGLTDQKLKAMKQKGMTTAYVLMFIGSLVSSLILAYIIAYAEVTTVLGGAAIGLMTWLGFVATTSLGMVLWEGKPVGLYLLNNGHSVVMAIITGGILAAL